MYSSIRQRSWEIPSLLFVDLSALIVTRFQAAIREETPNLPCLSTCLEVGLHFHGVHITD